ncbi:DUF4194 domain-containing protein [Caldicoprobacter faecalis]|uniref:DUF4194 domain-containing protein n=1 Tax=Caldicoprobacter faecalis TaxID=937334 RepID=A0A1I5XFV5_9FIRM|nr:DUF4194 domain-containing protein [Caldicoprobacter faecalis]PZN10678.1 MAG: DUF4194 domain-containing protein [Caldicoprobacter oshimai]SFQ30706.1 protein of unknown function [Caldicoprobacter faecalis]
MWVEEYEKLSNSEKEEFRRLLNLILSRTFIIRDVYDPKEGMMRVNPEYRFVERNFALFNEYLWFSGWALYKDSQYGVIALVNTYEYNRVRLDRNTTLILFILRLIFEEEREKVTLRKEVLTSTGQIVHKMLTLGLIKKKPSDRDLAEALRQLAYYNIIQKLEGRWEDPDNKLLILPSILFVVTNEKISRIYETLGDEEDSDQESEETEDQDIIRGEVEE